MQPHTRCQCLCLQGLAGRGVAGTGVCASRGAELLLLRGWVSSGQRGTRAPQGVCVCVRARMCVCDDMHPGDIE